MADDSDTNMEIYSLYLATAEKVSDCRASANTWMLSVNTAVVALYGYLSQGKESVDAFQKIIWLWAIPIAGILVCIAWTGLLSSYSKLNGAKFTVLHEIEKSMPISAFKREQEVYRAMGRRQFSGLERRIPFAFATLYGLLLLVSILDVFLHLLKSN